MKTHIFILQGSGQIITLSTSKRTSLNCLIHITISFEVQSAWDILLWNSQKFIVTS